jgi:hypothetical protein
MNIDIELEASDLRALDEHDRHRNNTSCSIGILSTLKGWMPILKNRQNRRSV